MTDAQTPKAGSLTVSSLAQARRKKRRYDALLTLEDPRVRPGHRLRFTNKPCPDHLVLAFEDCDTEEFGYAVSRPEQVADALEFARKHAGGSLLVHCLHGVGRSAAVALAILADRLGQGREAEAVEQLLELASEATPNLIVVAQADQLLMRNGMLVQALREKEAKLPAKLRKRQERYEFAKRHPELYARFQSDGEEELRP